MRKKILHFQLVPILSGVQNVMFHLLEGLPREEYDIYVMSQPGKILSDEVLRHGYNYIPLPGLRRSINPSDLIVFFRLIRILRQYRFDIVHTHSSKPGLMGRIAARLTGVPQIIHTGHGAPFHYGQSRLVFAFYIFMERLGALFGNHLVFVNSYLKEFYIKNKMVRPQQACTIHNALSPTIIASLIQDKPRHQVTDGMVTIGSILRFTEAKNIVKTILAAIHICQARDDVRFIFVGDGEFMALCRHMVETNDLGQRILLPGWKEDTVEHYQSFDAFMLYSIFEGLPMCVIEAMYAALPIIGSDIPGIAELVDSSNGWLIPNDNLPALEASLHEIIGDKDQFLQKGRVSREKAEKLCSYERFIESYQALYNGENV